VPHRRGARYRRSRTEFEAPVGVLEGTGLQGFRDSVIPVLEAQSGFEGYLILLNCEKGKLLGITCGTPTRTAGSPAPGTGDDEMGTDSPVPDYYDVIAKQ